MPVVAQATLRSTSRSIAAWTSVENPDRGDLPPAAFAAEHVVPSGEVVEHHFFFVELFRERVAGVAWQSMRRRYSVLGGPISDFCRWLARRIVELRSFRIKQFVVVDRSTICRSSGMRSETAVSSARLPNSTTCDGAEGAVVVAGVSHGVGNC